MERDHLDTRQNSNGRRLTRKTYKSDAHPVAGLVAASLDGLLDRLADDAEGCTRNRLGSTGGLGTRAGQEVLAPR